MNNEQTIPNEIVKTLNKINKPKLKELFNNTITKYTDIYDDIDLNEMPDDFWKTPGKIITDKEYLSKPTKKVSLELGEKIAAKLLHTIVKTRTAVGLTANQIGIPYSVFVINVIQPMIFINPEIIYFSNDTIIFKEHCLSIPNKKCTVKRSRSIKIKSDNIEAPIKLGIEDSNVAVNTLYNSKLMLECIAAQHEYDHTQGLLITDRDITPQSVVKEHTFGRNDKVKVRRGKEIQLIKYKKLDFYKSNGWELVTIG